MLLKPHLSEIGESGIERVGVKSVDLLQNTNSAFIKLIRTTLQFDVDQIPSVHPSPCFGSQCSHSQYKYLQSIDQPTPYYDIMETKMQVMSTQTSFRTNT